MPRRPIKKKRFLLPDPVYNSVSVRADEHNCLQWFLLK